MVSPSGRMTLTLSAVAPTAPAETPTSSPTNSPELVQLARLPRIRLHDLRHTHATLALQAGVHPKVVQERLGHASVKVTLDTYSHVLPPMHQEAAARVAALIDVA